MLFDTPNLRIDSTKIKSSSSTDSPNQSKKRKHSSTSTPQEPQVNLDNLLKKLKGIEKDSGWGGQLGGGGKSGERVEQGEAKGKGKMKKRQEKREQARTTEATSAASKEGEKKPHRFEPQKKPRQSKNDKKRQRQEQHSDPLSSSNSIPISYPLPPAVAPAPKRTFQAPTQTIDEVTPTTIAPQTAMQKQLRAKLAGGKFRMLNEVLYTTTGSEALETMQEEGAFDDYHAGFRSQSSHWPTNPLSIFTSSLSSLPPRTLIADFGCGDAALSRSLAQSGQKVLAFDLVSKDGWVVQAECSSVPLPGGDGGEVVDVVVCCLSLMGTDWVRMIREARRVLVDGGQLKIAEVTSRFTDVDAFVNLITSIGFSLVSKDTTNTHFILFDFVKSDNGEEMKKKRANDDKAKELLKPCIYKRR